MRTWVSEVDPERQRPTDQQQARAADLAGRLLARRCAPVGRDPAPSTVSAVEPRRRSASSVDLELPRRDPPIGGRAQPALPRPRRRAQIAADGPAPDELRVGRGVDDRRRRESRRPARGSGRAGAPGSPDRARPCAGTARRPGRRGSSARSGVGQARTQERSAGVEPSGRRPARQRPGRARAGRTRRAGRGPAASARRATAARARPAGPAGRTGPRAPSRCRPRRGRTGPGRTVGRGPGTTVSSARRQGRLAGAVRSEQGDARARRPRRPVPSGVSRRSTRLTTP